MLLCLHCKNQTPNLINNLLANIAINVRCAAVAMLDTSMSHKNPNIKTCSNLFGLIMLAVFEACMYIHVLSDCNILGIYQYSLHRNKKKGGMWLIL